jgi:hypothetical protein
LALLFRLLIVSILRSAVLIGLVASSRPDNLSKAAGSSIRAGKSSGGLDELSTPWSIR